MRLIGALFGSLSLICVGEARAETVSYPCTTLGSNAFALVGDTVSPAEYRDSSAPILVIDWEQRRMGLSSGSQMPMIANEQAVIGVLREVTPAGNGADARQVYGTVTLVRATGRLTADLHILTEDALLALKVAYQCRTASGATSF